MIDIVLSKRAKIVEAILQQIRKVETVDAAWIWRTIAKDPLLSMPKVYTPAVSVFDFQEQTREDVKPSGEIAAKRLFVLVEFWAEKALNQNSSEVLDMVLAKIQKWVFADPTCGGLAQSITEAGSKHKVESKDQVLLMGEVVFVVNYILHQRDPFQAP